MAKSKSESPRTHTITARCTESEYKAFQKFWKSAADITDGAQLIRHAVNVLAGEKIFA